ncbi:12113_t:CDS:2 [Entrophospora sp. SA101]|nr:12113_t:CDS:2 [Entrophospora sp. SA101]
MNNIVNLESEADIANRKQCCTQDNSSFWINKANFFFKQSRDVVKMAVLNLEDKLFLENPYLEIKSKFQLILENLIKNNQINENILSHINKLSKINNVDHGFEIISELSAKNYQSLDDIDSIMMTFVQKKIENMLRFFKASSTFWEKDHSESFKTGLIFLPMMFNLFYGKYNIKTSKDLELVITENGKKQPIEDIRKEKSDTVKLCGELQYMINLIYKKLEIEKQPRFMNKFKEFKVFGLIKSGKINNNLSNLFLNVIKL